MTSAPLVPARFGRRTSRFSADVLLSDGTAARVFVPHAGRLPVRDGRLDAQLGSRIPVLLEARP